MGEPRENDESPILVFLTGCVLVLAAGALVGFIGAAVVLHLL